MKKVACIGSVTTDILLKPVDGMPAPGVLQSVNGMEMHVGGCASNAAIDLAKLGIPSALLCRVGNDIFGDFVKTTCEKAGVDIRGVVSNEASATTTSVVCISSTGERSFLYYPGSAADFTKSDINSAVAESCDIIFVAGAFLNSCFDGTPCAEFLKDAREKGNFTVMDTAWDFSGRWLPVIAGVLPHLDLFMPSYDEAKMIAGLDEPEEIADFFFDRGVKTVIIKLGKHGALICENRDKKYAVPSYIIDNPADTTGAGDSFCAGFLAGLSMGWNYEKSGKFANAVGAHCVMAVGASTGIKPVEEILAFMEKRL